MKKASLPREINLLLANMARSLAAEVARAVTDLKSDSTVGPVELTPRPLRPRITATLEMHREE